MARKKGSIPVPASSGRPSPLTRPPSSPVRSARSKFRTAARNCGELMVRWRASGDGGVGKSGGSCENNAGTSSGWAVNKGVRVEGVNISESERSMEEECRG